MPFLTGLFICCYIFRTIANLDFETFSEFLFRVQVRDSGEPSLCADSPAEVSIKASKQHLFMFLRFYSDVIAPFLHNYTPYFQVININDSPPKFSQEIYETVLLLPTYVGVEVLRIEALDPDVITGEFTTPKLFYSLVDSNMEYFFVDRYSGVVTVANRNLSKDRYRFNVRVSDCPFL